MAMKHKITINVSDSNGKKANVLRAADMRLPARIARFLFGDFTKFICLLQGRQLNPWM